jgi:hypothetical protein
MRPARKLRVELLRLRCGAATDLIRASRTVFVIGYFAVFFPLARELLELPAPDVAADETTC